MKLFQSISQKAATIKENVIDKAQHMQLDDQYYFQQSNQNQEQIIQQLKGLEVKSILNGCKSVLALYIKKQNIKPYINSLIPKIAHENAEIRFIVYYLVSQISSEPDMQNELIMCISPLIKQTTCNVQLTRGQALKCFSSLNTNQQNMVLNQSEKVLTDNSAYVKRIAAISLFKLLKNYSNEIHLKDDIVQKGFKILAKDIPFVNGVAFLINYELTQSFDYLHEHFMKLIENIYSYTMLDQIKLMQIIKFYTIYYFHQFNQKNPNEIPEQEKQEMQKIFNMCENQLHTANCSVVIEAAQIMINFPNTERIKLVINSLYRFLNISSESKYVILKQLEILSLEYPKLFVDQEILYLYNIEKPYCKILKIQILANICNKFNLNDIWQEISYYTYSNIPLIQQKAIQVIPQIAFQAQNNKQALQHLFQVDITVQALIEFIQEDITNKYPILINILKYMHIIQNPQTKSLLIGILVFVSKDVFTNAMEQLRLLAISFIKEDVQVKLQILNLALQLLKQNPDCQKLIQIFKHVHTLAIHDQNYLVRDLARQIKLKFLKTTQNVFEIANEQISLSVKTNVDCLQRNSQVLKQCFENKFNNYKQNLYTYKVNSISNVLNERIKGYDKIKDPSDRFQGSSYKLREKKVDILKQPSQKKQESQQEILKQQKQKEIENKQKQEQENQIQKQTQQDILDDFFGS